ncbi:MAG TPA: AAA family ATPase [Candidatus Deferrimicrobium sp.]|nr:AAA family ATPase [Candidatus Deferrimicrobium sp.]
MRQVYLAATGMNRGKTTFALGLLAALLERGLSTAFTKPVGQRYAMVDDIPADEDAILMRATFGLADPYELMSPVHIPRGFTKAFIRGDIVEDLGARIEAAHARLAEGREALLIEGTGHAGVGAVIGLSNAVVAARLRAPAVIVSEAGVGRPIDEIVLNAALFAQHGVPLAGAVVNKVDLDADPSLIDVLRGGLARHGIELLGVLPYRPILAHPTLAMLLEQMHGELLHPGDDMDRAIEHVAIGDMEPAHMVARFGPGTLLILPGDRRDVVAAAVTAHRAQQALRPRALRPRADRPDPQREHAPLTHSPADPATVSLTGMVFSGGIRPRQRDLDALREAGLFAYLMEAETYEVASQVHGLLVKTHPANRAKIEEIKRLVTDHFDVDGLLERLDGLTRLAGWSGPSTRIVRRR